MEVIAIVKSIAPNAFIDHMVDGTDIAWTAVTFKVEHPQHLAGTTVATHCSGNPIVSGRALRLGDKVAFVLPVHPELEQVFLYHLERLRLVSATGTPAN